MTPCRANRASHRMLADRAPASTRGAPSSPLRRGMLATRADEQPLDPAHCRTIAGGSDMPRCAAMHGGPSTNAADATCRHPPRPTRRLNPSPARLICAPSAPRANLAYLIHGKRSRLWRTRTVAPHLGRSPPEGRWLRERRFEAPRGSRLLVRVGASRELGQPL